MTTWTLPAELTIFHVAELHRDWLARLAEHDAAAGAAAAGDEARIDAAALQQIDGAGLQLLLALRKALVERGLAVSCTMPASRCARRPPHCLAVALISEGARMRAETGRRLRPRLHRRGLGAKQLLLQLEDEPGRPASC
jgi:ABC-type transporter Mla MlaB component